ncbi:MAG: hypothetical protein IJ404_04740 [Clostridia bacterium]|nr:hypothetical protein [Clostridia bacterium]
MANALTNIGLQYVDSVEDAWEKYIDKHLRDEYMVYDDDLEDGEIISCYIG